MPRQTGWRRPRHAECIRTGEPTQAAYECLWFRWKIFQTIDCLRRRSMCRLIVILKRNCDSHTRGLSHTTRNGTLRCCATRTSRQNLHPPWTKFWACGTEPALDLPAASLLFEATVATSIEKAFVDQLFNELSTSAHAGDSLFSLAAFSLQQRSLEAAESLSRSH